MEDWQLDYEWLRVRHWLNKRFKRDVVPDMNAVLLIIGVQELGEVKPSYTKEEKQDLMHIAICRLLTYENYFRFVGLDAEGWPHYEVVRPFPMHGEKAQELYLRKQVVTYFTELGLNLDEESE